MRAAQRYMAVSYTHLDVYKRQGGWVGACVGVCVGACVGAWVGFCVGWVVGFCVFDGCEPAKTRAATAGYVFLLMISRLISFPFASYQILVVWDFFPFLALETSLGSLTYCTPAGAGTVPICSPTMSMLIPSGNGSPHTLSLIHI